MRSPEPRRAVGATASTSDPQIGPYRIVAKLADTATGPLYEARERATGAAVALRVVPDRPAENGDRTAPRASDRSPVTGSARIPEHPNVVPVLASGRDAGQAFVATPYVPEPTLAERLLEGPLPRGELVRLATDVGAALDHAHRHGVVHGALKPASVLWTRGGGARLTDFGIADLLDPAARLAGGATDGTPLYLSPEQCLGRPATAASDVYALGALLFEAATGTPPFRAATPLLVSMKHVEAPVPSARAVRPELAAAVDEVLARALAKRPADRPDSPGALARELVAALGGAAPARAVPSGRDRLRRWAPAIGFALLIWSTLPFTPSLLKVGGTLFQAFIRAFTTLAVLGGTAAAVIVVVFRWRVREEVIYWRLFGLVLAYGLALMIYGADPVEQTHLVYYGLLSVLVFRALAPTMTARRAHWWSVGIVALLGTVDELLQLTIGRFHDSLLVWLAAVFDSSVEAMGKVFRTRYFDTRDIRLNATAAALAQLALAWWRSLPRPEPAPPSEAAAPVRHLVDAARRALDDDGSGTVPRSGRLPDRGSRPLVTNR